MGWGTGIGVIVVGNLLYVGLRVWLGRGIKPGLFGQVSDLATKRLIAELTRLDVPDHAAAALGRIEGPALAQGIHKSLMRAFTSEDEYIEEFTAALSARARRFAVNCAWKFRTENERAARYEENFRAYHLWYVKFVDGAGEVNPMLEIMSDGTSLCDELDAEPLFQAFDAALDPKRLGRQFAGQVEEKAPDYLDAVLRRLVRQEVSRHPTYEPARALS
jgi:hypothetical protein